MSKSVHMAQTTHTINKFVMIYEILQYDSKEMSHDISIFFLIIRCKFIWCSQLAAYAHSNIYMQLQFVHINILYVNSLKIQNLLISRYVKKSRDVPSRECFLEKKHTMESD